MVKFEIIGAEVNQENMARVCYIPVCDPPPPPHLSTQHELGWVTFCHNNANSKVEWLNGIMVWHMQAIILSEASMLSLRLNLRIKVQYKFLFVFSSVSILQQPLTMELPVITHLKEVKLCRHLKLILCQTSVKVWTNPVLLPPVNYTAVSI